MKKTCKRCANRKKYVVQKFSGQYIADCELCIDPKEVLKKEAEKQKEIDDKLKAILKTKSKYNKAKYTPKYNAPEYKTAYIDYENTYKDYEKSYEAIYNKYAKEYNYIVNIGDIIEPQTNKYIKYKTDDEIEYNKLMKFPD